MFGLFRHSGSAPSPFNALDGPRLAGPEGSHPLHEVRIEELLTPSDGRIVGEIALDGPVRVGDGITGTIRLRALSEVRARGGALRRVGLRLDETRREREDRDAKGNVTHREAWVEARGRLFDELGFVEPSVPATMAAGQEWESSFRVPAPPLGPPTAHLGESIVAWALEVRWDVPMGGDAWVAAPLPLAQNADLMAAGVGDQGGQSLMRELAADGGVITVLSELPAPAGADLRLQIAWPGAPSGRAIRAELHRRSNAPNAEEGIVASVPVERDQLAGAGEIVLPVPSGIPPSFDGAGLENRYVLRVLVDRPLRPDAAIERPVGVL
jgi:hypothetical protein